MKMRGFISIIVLLIVVSAVYMLLRPTKGPSEDQQIANGEQTKTESDVAPIEESGSPVFHISTDQSLVEFRIGEVLRGEDFMVVGKTAMVSGDITLDMKNPSASKIETIRVNARTLETDDNGRNNMIKRFILKTEDDANEFIVFEPGSVTGWPDTFEVGVPFDVIITGDATIAGVTKSVTFTGTTQLVDEKTISGEVRATVTRKDFNLVIPSVPFVASVNDDVELVVTIVAKSE